MQDQENPISGRVIADTPLGFRVELEDGREGLIFFSEVTISLRVDDELEVVIKKIRENGNIDLGLPTQSYSQRQSNVQDKILEVLKDSNGFISVSDKSAPEEIMEKFGLSKKKFKEALGGLYKSKKIVIHKDSIERV